LAEIYQMFTKNTNKPLLYLYVQCYTYNIFVPHCILLILINNVLLAIHSYIILYNINKNSRNYQMHSVTCDKLIILGNLII